MSSRPTPVEPPPTSLNGVRASDAERQDVADRLHHALAEGRLDLAETDARVAAAYAAPYRDDLTPLLADLPRDDGGADAAPTWAAIWTSTVWRARMALDPTARNERPTPRQCGNAALLAAVLLVWMAACAVLGAVLVAA